jgi:hypothetical protein
MDFAIKLFTFQGTFQGVGIWQSIEGRVGAGEQGAGDAAFTIPRMRLRPHPAPHLSRPYAMKNACGSKSATEKPLPKHQDIYSPNACGSKSATEKS